MGVSEAFDDTGLCGKMGSTTWDWSQSLQGSRNNKKEKKRKYFKNTSWNVSEHCFVTSEAPIGFPELRIFLLESEKCDLQFGSGPRASGAQKIRKISEKL